MWHLIIETDQFLCCTAWFFLHASHGAMDLMNDAWWWGIRLKWHRKDDPQPHQDPFLKLWSWDFRAPITLEQVVDTTGIPKW